MAKRDAAIFHHCANAHGMLLLTAVALPQKPLVALAGLAIRHFVNVGIAAPLAARATFAPAQRFDELNCRKFIGARLW